SFSAGMYVNVQVHILRQDAMSLHCERPSMRQWQWQPGARARGGLQVDKQASKTCNRPQARPRRHCAGRLALSTGSAFAWRHEKTCGSYSLWDTPVEKGT